MVSIVVIHELGGDERTATVLLTARMAVGIGATLLGGAVAGSVGRVRCIRFGVVVSARCLVLLVLAPNLWFAATGAVLVGLGAFLLSPVQTTLGHQYLPRHLGTASGVPSGSQCPQAVPVLGLISDTAGPREATAALALLPLVAPPPPSASPTGRSRPARRHMRARPSPHRW